MKGKIIETIGVGIILGALGSCAIHPRTMLFGEAIGLVLGVWMANTWRYPNESR